MSDRITEIKRFLTGLASEQYIQPIAKRFLLEAADRLESQSKQIAELTARADSAERERDAAVNNAVRAVFYDTSNGKPALLLGEGICRYCQSDKGERIKCKSCFENGNFELRNNLRGQPQDGEGV